jgi:hypothetical protein
MIYIIPHKLFHVKSINIDFMIIIFFLLLAFKIETFILKVIFDFLNVAAQLHL